jgi:hypothetical protein
MNGGDFMRFELGFLGIGSAFNTELGNTAAFFKDEFNNIYFIDCGYDVFPKIMKHNLLDGVNDITVFITHLHDDHMGSLGALTFYCFYVLKKKLTIKFPNFDIARLLKIQGALRCANFDIVKEGTISEKKVKILEYEFTTTNHDKSIPCYSLKIKNHTMEVPQYIYYSGDTKVLFNGSTKFDDIFTLPYVEVYQDCSHEKSYEGAVHMDLETLSSLIPKKHRLSVTCMHIGPDCPIDKIIDKGFLVAHLYET